MGVSGTVRVVGGVQVAGAWGDCRFGPQGLLAQGAVGVAGAAWANHKVGLLAGIRFSGEIGGKERLLSRAGGGAGWRHFLNLLRLIRRSLVMSCVRLLVAVLVVAAISGVVVSGAAVDTVGEVGGGRLLVSVVGVVA